MIKDTANPKKRRLSGYTVCAFILATIWAFVTILPFYYMILASFKTSKELTMSPLSFPGVLNLSNYAKVLSDKFPSYFWNSLRVLVYSEIFILIVASMGAYVFSRMENKITKRIFSVVIACMSIPTHIAFIPVFILNKNLGTYDSIWALIPTYVAFQLPISIFMLSGFMKSIPREMEEAATIDGASIIKTFLRIIIPLSLPGLVTVAIYDGIFFWNEYSFALILTSTPASRTLPLAISDFKSEYTVDIPAVMAVLTLSVLPMLLAFSIGQKRLVKGMMAGAVKG